MSIVVRRPDTKKVDVLCVPQYKQYLVDSSIFIYRSFGVVALFNVVGTVLIFRNLILIEKAKYFL